MPSYRTCSACKKKRRLETYNWKIKGVRRQTKCKFCMREYSRQHYKKNKEYYKQKAHDTEKKRKIIKETLKQWSFYSEYNQPQQMSLLEENRKKKR